MAKDVDGQLKQMVQDLKSIIDHLNTANTQQQDSDDPVSYCYLVMMPVIVKGDVFQSVTQAYSEKEKKYECSQQELNL